MKHCALLQRTHVSMLTSCSLCLLTISRLPLPHFRSKFNFQSKFKNVPFKLLTESSSYICMLSLARS